MVDMLMTYFRSGISALAFVRNNFAFSIIGHGDAEAEHKRRDLTEENLQRAKDIWN